MASIELAYEIRNFADYLIAAPTEVLADPNPLLTCVPKLFEPNFDPIQTAQSFSRYWNTKTGVYKTGSISVIDLKEVENLTRSIAQFFKHDKLGNFPKVEHLQQFSRNNHQVFFDLKDVLEKTAMLNDILIKDIERQFDRTILFNKHSDFIIRQLAVKKCSGLNVYYPNAKNKALNAYYESLTWFSASNYERIFKKLP